MLGFDVAVAGVPPFGGVLSLLLFSFSMWLWLFMMLSLLVETKNSSGNALAS